MPPSVGGLWSSSSLTPTGRPEIKSLGVQQVNRCLSIMYNWWCPRPHLTSLCLPRFSSYLPQGSQVSHLCQWSFVHVGKNDFLNHQIPGEMSMKEKIKAVEEHMDSVMLSDSSGDSTFVSHRVTVCGTSPSLCF